MEKTGIGITAMIMGTLGGIFALVGLIHYVVLPEQVKIVGGVFVIVGVAFLLMTFMMVRMVRKIQEKSMDIIINGQKKEANILEVKEITAIRVNRRHPYMVVCESEGRIFESEFFYRDVHRFDERKTIDVYLDPDSDDYYVDLQS